MSSASIPSRSASRERGTAFGGLVVGGGLGLVAAAQPWWRALAAPADVPFSGTAATGGLGQALPVVALAGALLAATLRGSGRSVLAVVLGAAALAMVLLGALRPRPGQASVRAALRTVTLSEEYTLAATGWPWVYAGAGLLTLGGAAVLLVRGRSWPRRADRFRPPGSAPVSEQAASARPGQDPAAVWAALDAGLDPTVMPPDQPLSTDTGSPDVRPTGAQDTMGGKPQVAGPGVAGPREPPSPE
ncbi:MAG: Trp biosynthesis-associated membrane protein [Actinomycetes bacterium]